MSDLSTCDLAILLFGIALLCIVLILISMRFLEYYTGRYLLTRSEYQSGFEDAKAHLELIGHADHFEVILDMYKTLKYMPIYWYGFASGIADWRHEPRPMPWGKPAPSDQDRIDG